MSANRVRGNPLTITLLALGVGAALGMALGWLLPVQRSSATLDKLHPDYKAEYLVMVGSTYLQSGDWQTAEARLARLNEDNLATYVGQLADQYITEGRNVNDVRSLAALAGQLGYSSTLLQPYLPEQVPGQ